jgi:isopentenyl-diphosphate delta-isomerase
MLYQNQVFRDKVEVVDDNDMPLCILPLGEAKKQSLNHRYVVLFISDGKGKILLRKRDADAELYPERWDVSLSGHVRAGESRSEAASRRLRREMGVRGNRLVLRHEIPASSSNNYRFTTIFSTICSIDDPGIRDLMNMGVAMFVDQDEAESLALNCRESLTPGLVDFIEKGLVFTAKPSTEEEY